MGIEVKVGEKLREFDLLFNTVNTVHLAMLDSRLLYYAGRT